MDAGADAELAEALGRALGERVQFGIADAPVEELERGPLAVEAAARSSTLATGAISSGASARTPAG